MTDERSTPDRLVRATALECLIKRGRGRSRVRQDRGEIAAPELTGPQHAPSRIARLTKSANGSLADGWDHAC
jgi:hypothetical protein